MTEPKTLSQLAEETKALVRDLVAEAAEVRKHPSITGLPGNLFGGFDGARQRLDAYLNEVEAAGVNLDQPAADAAGLHAAADTPDSDPSSSPGTSAVNPTADVIKPSSKSS